MNFLMSFLQPFQIYSFCFHSLLKINHAASLQPPNSMRVHQQGLTKAAKIQVMRITLTLSSWVFLKALQIRENGGNLLANMCMNSNGPVSMTCTVGADVTGMTKKHLHLIFPLPMLYIFANVWGHNFYLLKSFVWCECQSAWMFWGLGRYFSVSVIQFTIKYSQISFKILLSFTLFLPPIFTKWDRAFTLLICRWTDFAFFIFQND